MDKLVPSSTFDKVPAVTGVSVVAAVLAIALLSKWSGTATQGKTFAPKVSKELVTLVKTAARWSAVSEQDSNHMLKLLHATYASAYINAARALASDADLERVSKVRIDELYSQVSAQQQAAIQKVGALAPSLMPEGANVLYTGWI
jgi:hypothetical protein